MIDVLHMLFGAALVASGVFAAALADRIRGLRVSRELPIRARARTISESRELPTRPIEVVEPKPVKDAAQRLDSTANDVIAALVAAGYKKAIAAEAAWSCTAAERATIENWTRAALRRCARGGMS